MKKINNWIIRTFGLRGSWSWAKKQMLNGAIIKRKATTGTYKIAIDDDKNRLLVAMGSSRSKSCMGKVPA